MSSGRRAAAAARDLRIAATSDDGIDRQEDFEQKTDAYQSHNLSHVRNTPRALMVRLPEGRATADGCGAVVEKCRRRAEVRVRVQGGILKWHRNST